jgi:predicted ribonuclease toxin of YeeF-YezG toxin-antitoxin module
LSATTPVRSQSFSSSTTVDRSFFNIAALCGCIIAARTVSAVVCRAKRHLTWYHKQWQNQEYLARHPRPALKKTELERRLLKIKLFRRQDEYWNEFFVYNDPRDDRWQWSVAQVRQYLDEQATSVDDIKRLKLTSREDVGLPLAPTDQKLRAMQRITVSGMKAAEKSEQLGQAVTEKKVEEEEKADDKKKLTRKSKAQKDAEEKGPDLTNIDSEFMAYKGLVMTKRQKAAAAARAAAKAKKNKK